MTYYTHRIMHLSTPIIEAYFNSTWQLTQRPTTGQGIENKGPLRPP